MNAQTAGKVIPLELLKSQGHNSEEDLQKKEPKVYKIVKWFASASNEDQEVFLKLVELQTSGDDRVKDLIKGKSSGDLWFVAKSMIKNNRSIDDLFKMPADEFLNLEE